MTKPKRPRSSLNPGDVLEKNERLPSVDSNGNRIKYVNVDRIEERIVSKPVVKEVENIKYVPKKEIVYEDVEVDKPEYRFVDVERTIPVKKEVIKEVKKIIYEDRIVEEVRRVPKIKEVKVSKIVEVLGPLQETKRYNDIVRKHPKEIIKTNNEDVIISQTVVPRIVQTNKVADVTLETYTPKLKTIDIHVPIPLDVPMQQVVTSTDKALQVVPSSQYNSLLMELNKHLTEEQKLNLPFRLADDGSIPLLGEKACPGKRLASLITAQESTAEAV